MHDQLASAVKIACLNGQERLHRERVSELDELCSIVGLRVEHGHRLRGMAFGDLAVGVVPLVDGEGMVISAYRGGLAELTSDPHRAPAGRDRITQPIDEVELPGKQLEQLRFVLGGQWATLIECDREELGGLGVRAGSRSRNARVVCGAPNPVYVLGAQRMMGQHRRIDVGCRFVRVDQPSMQTRLGTGRDDASDRQPAQIVAERHAA